MKLIILAFILSITLHILFFSSYKQIKKDIKDSPSTSKKVDKNSKSKIRYVKLLPKIQKIQKDIKVEKKNEIPTPKTKVFTKVDKKKIVSQKKKKIVKKAKKILPKPIERVEIKPTFTKPLPKKKIIKSQEKRKTVPKKSLENFLLADPAPLDRNMLDDITKSYINLYGEEYNSFTKVQKVFLQKKLKDIGRITQRYLRYPNIAIRTGQQGMNIVQFYLHPNGDISQLKLVDSSGYTSLDKNSIKTIEIAYKDYPRPKTKTKIKIYVYYKLY